MTFDWSKYYDLAQELIDQAQDQSIGSDIKEAKLRSALSRVYYACYRTAKNYLIAKSLYSPTRKEQENDHIYVRDQFRDRLNPRKDQVANNLKRLRLERNKADYDDEFGVDLVGLDKIAKSNMSIGRMTLESLRRLSSQR